MCALPIFRNIGYITHIGLVDAAVPKRHVRALHFVEPDEIPRRSERLCSEHLELIVVEDEGEFQPQECGEQPEPYEQRNARAAPPHRELVADKLRAEIGRTSGRERLSQ